MTNECYISNRYHTEFILVSKIGGKERILGKLTSSNWQYTKTKKKVQILKELMLHQS